MFAIYDRVVNANSPCCLKAVVTIDSINESDWLLDRRVMNVSRMHQCSCHIATTAISHEEICPRPIFSIDKLH